MSSKAEILKQHELVYETPPRIWQDGFPIGNGHMGAMVYQPHGAALEMMITKLDVWDRRADRPRKIPLDRIRKLEKSNPAKMLEELNTEFPGPDDHNPGPKPCGKLTIALDEWALSPQPGLFFKPSDLTSIMPPWKRNMN